MPFVDYRFAEEELAKQQLAASERWGFDFARGQPLSNQKIFLWERVPSEHDMPKMYTLTRAAHIRPIDDVTQSPKPQRRFNRSSAAASYMDLLDQRADELNKDITENVLDLSFEDIEGGHSSSESCDESSFEEATHEKMFIDSMIDSVSKSANVHSVQLTSTSTSATSVTSMSSSSSAFVSATAPPKCGLTPSASVIRSTIQTRNCINQNSSSTGTNSGNSSNSTSNNNNNNKTNNQNSCKNIRSSPRNREKRQPKITGKLRIFYYSFTNSVFLLPLG